MEGLSYLSISKECVNCSSKFDNEKPDSFHEICFGNPTTAVENSSIDPNKVQIRDVLASIYRFDLISQENQNKSSSSSVHLCLQCSTVLANLHRYYEYFNKLRKLGSILAERIQYVENCILIPNPNLNQESHSVIELSPASKVTPTSTRATSSIKSSRTRRRGGRSCNNNYRTTKNRLTTAQKSPVSGSSGLTLPIRSPSFQLRNLDQSSASVAETNVQQVLNTENVLVVPVPVPVPHDEVVDVSCGSHAAVVNEAVEMFVVNPEKVEFADAQEYIIEVEVKESAAPSRNRFPKSWLHHLEKFGIPEMVEGPPYNCPKCSKVKPTFVQFQVHLRDSHMVPRKRINYKCPDCPVQFKTYKSIRRHANHSHGKKYVNPDGRKIKDKSLPRQSVTIRSSGETFYFSQGPPYKCPKCENKFKIMKTLTHHYLTQHLKPRTYKCLLCRKNYANRDSLKRHSIKCGIPKEKRLPNPETCLPRIKRKIKPVLIDLKEYYEKVSPYKKYARKTKTVRNAGEAAAVDAGKETVLVATYLASQESSGNEISQEIHTVETTSVTPTTIEEDNVNVKKETAAPESDNSAIEHTQQSFIIELPTSAKPASQVKGSTILRKSSRIRKASIKMLSDPGGAQSVRARKNETDPDLTQVQVPPSIPIKSVKTIAQKPPFICPHCGKHNATRQLYSHHVLRHGPEESKPFICTPCGKRFVSQGAVNQHQSTHTDSKPFACQVCGRVVKTEQSLRRHMKIVHTAEGRLILEENMRKNRERLKNRIRAQQKVSLLPPNPNLNSNRNNNMNTKQQPSQEVVVEFVNLPQKPNLESPEDIVNHNDLLLLNEQTPDALVSNIIIVSVTNASSVISKQNS